MRTLGKAMGWLMMLMGSVWFLQGINILPGSFMTGQSQWAVYGGLLFAGGACVLWMTRRAGRTPPRP